MKQALVLHPRFTLYGGGELLCLNVIKALQDKGYHVTLASDEYSPVSCERIYGPLARCLAYVDRLLIPPFHRSFPRFLAYQHIRYAGQVQHLFQRTNPELVFSTQSSLYYVPGIDTYHFIYDMVDLSVVKFSHHIASTWWKWPYYRALKRYRKMLEKPEPTRHFLALGKAISHDLSELGYENQIILPPCPVDYGPLPKKKQIVQVTRVVPQKRLEEFAEIASHLSFDFHIIGLTNEAFKGYAKRVLAKMPGNVHYYEKPLRLMSQVLQESKVYLYTSHEPGLPIAVVQGMGAGCFPITPNVGGGCEAVELAGVGATYYNSEDAILKTRLAMESNGIEQELTDASARFSPESFREKIRMMIQ